MQKTYKIGEYAVGGIIQWVYQDNLMVLYCKDWDTEEVIHTEQVNSISQVISVLIDWTSSYYADTIVADIKKLTEFGKGDSFYA